MEDFVCSVSVSSLICQEDGADLDAADDEEAKRPNKFILLDEAAADEEYIELLAARERSFDRRSSLDDDSSCEEDSAVTMESWFRSERSAAVKWILKTRDYFGFSFHTAYLAIAYFDRFFLWRSIDAMNGKSWAIRLLSVACLSLAAKMEECRVPALSEFEIEEDRFDGSSVQRMELLVLVTLEWRMNIVTPFEYLNHFASKFQCKQGSSDLVYKAIEFIIARIDVINLVDYRPSAIAAAAVLAASNEIFTKELVESKISSINLFGSLEKEHVHSCFSVMCEESSKEMTSPKRLISLDLSANKSSISNAIDAMESPSFHLIKR